jgi:hypothetical protein
MTSFTYLGACLFHLRICVTDALVLASFWQWGTWVETERAEGELFVDTINVTSIPRTRL